MPRQLKAIVFVPGNKPNEFLKYNTVKYSTKSIILFETFIKKTYPAAKHINFYQKETGAFLKQVKMD